ncbi:MAG: hypothetical protein B7O98_04000 [Zestosphaera tikiterensis]|uniref:Archaemetzincin n=1 Tax=Zestosphaera tikiterensis TaxID=1973259 RepID=A0A2R7Y8F1_9CREN|nr:MAG: hypothetical protein B7O98_04000 [Zestosphaera tikiterensis]
MPEALVKSVLNILTYFEPVKTLSRELNDLPNVLYNPFRNQYRGTLVNKHLSSLRASPNSVVLGVLDVDAYVEPLNFIFGLATPYLMTATVYVRRLKLGANEEKLTTRVLKEVIHELGHIFGLEHCVNRKCVMSFSNNVFEVDHKELKYCEKHYGELIKKGFKVSNALKLTQ